jgi:hypothetical protein
LGAREIALFCGRPADFARGDGSVSLDWWTSKALRFSPIELRSHSVVKVHVYDVEDSDFGAKV